MSASGNIAERLAERWIERTLAAYPAQTQALLRDEQDRFRNPAGYIMVQSLTALARELMESMDKTVIAPALEGLVRLRAVQDFRPSEALRFIFDLRQLATDIDGPLPQDLESRIDELALMAFDLYIACRDRIAGLRDKELFFRRQYAG